MTFIQKLMIRGVRSFSPRESNTLEFYSPLTLIVGPNGTGKTTIIESLKYATTGSLPPNSKGGAFIYDPKVAQETEVKAQVKILFVNASNKSMICTRSLQLTQKRDRTEQKTLESVLWREGENGENVSVSSRCADIDAEMPHHLGVSTSVLESIIFCHQEESTWPLGEPVVVKKRLDEIFASSRYSKALDSLKTSKKECGADIRLKTNELGFLAKMREKKESLEARIRSHEAMIEKNERRLEAYEDELGRCNGVLGEIDSEVAEMGDVERRVCMLGGEYDRLRELVDGLQGDRLSLDEAGSVLEDMSLAGVEKEYEEEKERVLETEKRFLVLNEERSVYLRHKAELDGVFSELSTKSARLNDAKERRREFAGFLEAGLKVSGGFRETALGVFAKVEKDIEERREEIQRMQTRLQKLREESSGKMTVLGEKMDLISRYEGLESNPDVDVSVSHEEEMERLNGEMEAGHELVALEERLEEYQKRLNVAFAVAEKNFAMDQLRSRKREIEGVLDGRDVSKLRPALEEQQESLRRKRTRIWEIERSIGVRETLQRQRDLEMERTRGRLLERIAALECMRGENGVVWEETDVSLRRDAWEWHRRDVEDVVERNREFFLSLRVLESLDFEMVYSKNEAAEEAERISEVLGQSPDSAGVYRGLLRRGGERHGCPVCERSFSGCEEERFRRNLESMIEDTPARKSLLERRGRILRTLGAAEEANKQIEKRNRLREEIVGLVLECREKECPDGCGEEELENLELDVLDDVENIKREERCIELVDEMLLINEKLRGEEAGESVQELRSMVDGVKKVYEEKRSEKRLMQERMDVLKRKQDAVEAEKETRRMIRLREGAREAVRAIEENGLGAEIEKTEEEIRRKIAKLEKVQELVSRKRVGLEMNIEGLDCKEREIVALERAIEELNSRTGSLLKMGCSEGAKSEELFDSAKNDVLRSKGRVLELGHMVHSMHETRKMAEESMRIWRSEGRMEEIRREIDGFDVERLRQLKEKKGLLEEKRTMLISQKSLLLGECKQIALGIKASRSEIEKDHRNSAEEYGRCLVETKVLEMSCLDLEKCIQVLDRAIMDFHSSKLEEVNITLKDLWTGTYRGNDIDWIEIKAESLGHKTYSYRVVMVKNGVELDMRGRSSAGQRMIASILIRLALADSFAANCNILALDEPTTNLDRDNVESLAFTLSRIISRHRKDRNFQLIVITHDEDFVQLLSRDGPEYFYRLARDENGDSRIVRHSVYAN